jgi:hypothetical protein
MHRSLLAEITRKSKKQSLFAAGLFLACVMISGTMLAQKIEKNAVATAGKLPIAADLEGEWITVYDSEEPNCTSSSFTIGSLEKGNDERERVKGSEIRGCGPRQYRLNYQGALFDRREMLLLALNPSSPSADMEAVELLRGPDTPRYSPDRLTLWASSRDKCRLEGWRRDIGITHALILKKVDCGK